ncbi:MAG: hypothetical protein Q9185_004103 [Variospora sp. 1 TL-2023]
MKNNPLMNPGKAQFTIRSSRRNALIPEHRTPNEKETNRTPNSQPPVDREEDELPTVGGANDKEPPKPLPHPATPPRPPRPDGRPVNLLKDGGHDKEPPKPLPHPATPPRPPRPDGRPVVVNQAGCEEITSFKAVASDLGFSGGLAGKEASTNAGGGNESSKSKAAGGKESDGDGEAVNVKKGKGDWDVDEMGLWGKKRGGD